MRHSYLTMVDAAAVDPASEHSCDPAPTCLALVSTSSAFSPESGEQTQTSLAVVVIRGEAGRESLAHLHDTRSDGVSDHRAGVAGLIRLRVRVRCCSQLLSLIGFTSQSARHATVAPTCSRRSRCAPNLSTIRPCKTARAMAAFLYGSAGN